MASHSSIEFIARGLITSEGAVLLCRAVKAGYAYLPGGHIELGESAANALARELEEEAGIKCEVGPLLLVTEERFEQKGKQRHEVNLVFHVEHAMSAGGEALHREAPVASLEPQIAFDWIDLAAATDTDIRPASTQAWLASGMRSDLTAGHVLG